MFKLPLLLLLILIKLSASAQSIAGTQTSKSPLNKNYWSWELKSALEVVDSAKINLFKIENYLNILDPDSVQVILEPISGYSWVVYPRNIKSGGGSGLVTLPTDVLLRPASSKASE